MAEYVQFVGALVFLLMILIGSYWFVVYSPERRQEKKDDERG